LVVKRKFVTMHANMYIKFVNAEQAKDYYMFLLPVYLLEIFTMCLYLTLRSRVGLETLAVA
jgi:hypothetical protein